MNKKLLGCGLVSVPFIYMLFALVLTHEWKTVVTVSLICCGGGVVAVCFLIGLALLDGGLDDGL